MTAAAAVYPPLAERPIKNTLVLFDVDNTLTVPRQVSPAPLSPFLSHASQLLLYLPRLGTCTQPI